MSKKVAIITARGGSKRIPRKNIKEFCGKPIIAYSIEAAITSDIFDEVMVSTEDEEIAKIATSFGAKIPFLRSQKNSDDYAMTSDVIKEVILEYQKKNQSFEYLCCIYPTAPFVTAEKLKKATKILIENNVECVLPVVKYSYPIQRSLKIENNRAKMLWPENYSKRSQDLESIYHDTGQFYCLKTNSFLEQLVLFPENTLPLIVPESEVQDIDDDEDWKIAEMKYKILKGVI
ncbi:pseudaminic acid cytidylyltransferase [Desulfobacula sp.]|uniref:pseudaminic acid cytidylyltransferase n=1 Tax=Desulfobacula sp. TaxID=2593537 RepID=UPI0026192CB7|nr:pseudaminic acid cytidylyltransferase [Desulfobacula sp.]